MSSQSLHILASQYPESYIGPEPVILDPREAAKQPKIRSQEALLSHTSNKDLIHDVQCSSPFLVICLLGYALTNCLWY